MARVLFSCILFSACLAAGATEFPRPKALEPAVDFWVQVYSAITDDQGFLHDDVNLSVIYATLDLSAAANKSERAQLIAAAQQEVVAALTSLANAKSSDLSSAEASALNAWPAGTPASVFAQAAARVRFQVGLKNRFREGLERSGQWKPHIQDVLQQYELPLELDALPHVESSFDPSIYSSAAAAGLWQFIPSTGREYMRVDSIVDERLDPFIATDGAARLLKSNHRLTQTWPLALTGYNHGIAGVMQAQSVLGTSAIDAIVQHYQGPAFGFASRNFYVSFLAALQIDRNPEQYFDELRFASPIPYEVVVSEYYLAAKPFAQALGISLDALRRYNPALLAPVWSGEKYIPRGFPVRVPRARLQQSLQETLAALSIVAQFSQQKPDKRKKKTVHDASPRLAVEQYGGLSAAHVAATRARLAGRPFEYVVQSGDSLQSIAQRFNVPLQQLISFNTLVDKAQLQPDQQLTIPGVQQ